MFRSRAPRSAAAAALSIVLIAAFMVGTTTAATNHQASGRAAPAAPKPKPSPTPTPTPTPAPTPTPTPNSDNRTVYFGGIGVHGTRQHDRIVVVGPDLDRFARRVPTQQDTVTGSVQICGDGRTDRAGSDECNAGTHDRQRTGG